MLVRFNHTFFQFRWLLLFCIMWPELSAELFALPIKTSILNAEKQPVGRALVYIDYIELQDMDGTPKGRLGFVNIKADSNCSLYVMTGNRIWSEALKIGGYTTKKENWLVTTTGQLSGLTFMLRMERNLVRQSALLSGVFVPPGLQVF